MKILGKIKQNCLALFARSVFRLLGWRLTGTKSPHLKEVLIAAPHTTGWDYLIMVGSAWAFKFPIAWIGKKELFNFLPLRLLFLATGGIPIDRDSSNNMVKNLATKIQNMDEIHLCIPPEGSRKKKTGWRTGFYYIACEAKIPITCSYIDFKTKTAGIGQSIMPSGDIEADMQLFKQFYADKRGKFAERQTPVCIAVKST